MVKIRFWSDSNHRFLETEFSDKDWQVIVDSCRKVEIPLNCEILHFIPDSLDVVNAHPKFDDLGINSIEK